MNDKTIDYIFAATVGACIGSIHGVVMWATTNTGAIINEGGLGGTGSLDSSTATFIPASYLFYSNGYTLPLQVAAIIDAVALTIVLSSGWWLPKAMYVMEKLAEEHEENKRKDTGDEQ